MRTNRKRVNLPFLFRAADCRGADGKLIARSYGNELEGVFTRAGQAAAWDSNAKRHTVARGLPPLGMWSGDAALEMASAVTNACLQSENFGTTWSTLGSPTRTAAAHTSTGISLDLLGDDAAGAVEGYSQTITFTGDGSKTISIFFKAGTSTGISLQLIADGTFGRAGVDIAISGGVPTLSNIGGFFTAATLYTPQLISADGVYRLSFTASGVVASQTNVLWVYLTDPDTVALTGDVYLGGVQAENALTPGAYVKTTTVAASRVADLLYFPFLPVPQEMTVYVRHYDRGALLVGTGMRLITFGLAGSNDALYLTASAAAGNWRASHKTAAGGTVNSTAAATPTFNDAVELRMVLASTGAVTLGQSINAGTEAVAAASSANALAAAWNETRLYINGESGAAGRAAFTHVAVAYGTKTMAEMRELAEVY